MKLNQCALQLYTLRERMKTRRQLEETLGRVRDIGYPAVQISGLNWEIISEADMVALCRGLGLTICATHEAPETILRTPAKVVRRLRALGCRYTAFPYPADVDLGDERQVNRLIKRLERAGKVLAHAGQVLAYHNHHLEFRRLGDSTILERIFSSISARHLQAELDTYWVQFGGGTPVDWCRRLQGRLPLIHLKDLGISDANEVVFRELGKGNLDFTSIVKAGDAAGCQWYIVEQDVCPGDPFDSVAESFEYVRRVLATG